jgi:hypothetical protein
MVPQEALQREKRPLPLHQAGQQHHRAAVTGRLAAQLALVTWPVHHGPSGTRQFGSPQQFGRWKDGFGQHCHRYVI